MENLGPFHGMSVEHYYILFYDKILHYVIENANGLENTSELGGGTLAAAANGIRKARNFRLGPDVGAMTVSRDDASNQILGGGR